MPNPKNGYFVSSYIPEQEKSGDLTKEVNKFHQNAEQTMQGIIRLQKK